VTRRTEKGMEVCFHHRIKNKRGNCDFYLTIAGLHLTILTFYP